MPVAHVLLVIAVCCPVFLPCCYVQGCERSVVDCFWCGGYSPSPYWVLPHDPFIAPVQVISHGSFPNNLPYPQTPPVSTDSEPQAEGLRACHTQQILSRPSGLQHEGVKCPAEASLCILPQPMQVRPPPPQPPPKAQSYCCTYPLAIPQLPVPRSVREPTPVCAANITPTPPWLHPVAPPVGCLPSREYRLHCPTLSTTGPCARPNAVTPRPQGEGGGGGGGLPIRHHQLHSKCFPE